MMTAQLIIKPNREEVIRRELSFLRENWRPLREVFISTFTVSPLAILGVIIFGPAFVLSLLSALVGIIRG